MRTNGFRFASISFLFFSLSNVVCFFLIKSIDGIGFQDVKFYEIFAFPFFFCLELLGFSFLMKKRIYLLFPLFVFTLKLLIFVLGNKMYSADLIVYLTTYFALLFNIGQYYIQNHLNNSGGFLFHMVGMFLYQTAVIFLAIKITALVGGKTGNHPVPSQFLL